jgi:hypothetical protein
MDENSIGDYLFSQARTVARQQGYHFRPDSENLVREVCETAARNIVRMNRADETISEPALRNMGRLVILDLVDEMIEESRRIPGFRERYPGQLGEPTFHGAMSRLCPLWPIC